MRLFRRAAQGRLDGHPDVPASLVLARRIIERCEPFDVIVVEVLDDLTDDWVPSHYGVVDGCGIWVKAFGVDAERSRSRKTASLAFRQADALSTRATRRPSLVRDRDFRAFHMTYRTKNKRNPARGGASRIGANARSCMCAALASPLRRSSRAPYYEPQPVDPEQILPNGICAQQVVNADLFNFVLRHQARNRNADS